MSAESFAKVMFEAASVTLVGNTLGSVPCGCEVMLPAMPGTPPVETSPVARLSTPLPSVCRCRWPVPPWSPIRRISWVALAWLPTVTLTVESTCTPTSST